MNAHICGDPNSCCDYDCMIKAQEAKTSHEQMKYAYENNNIVHRIIKGGGNIYDCLYWMTKHQEDLQEKLISLELIAPKKIKLKDGNYAIWRCPDDLIPEKSLV